jgi:hypothetical protein
MTKASDNEFPKIILPMQTADTAIPTDSDWKLYSKADGVYARSSNSIVGPLSAAAAGSVATDAIWDASGDLVQGTGANTAAKLTLGTQGKVLKAGATSVGWTFGLYTNQRLWAQDPGNANATFNLNSTSYVAVGSLGFYHDWDAFPATHFLITAYGFASEVATINGQLTPNASPTNPVSAAGDDIAITNNGGAITQWSSGWVAVSDAMSGLVVMTVALKGSNGTVDFTGRWLDIAFKIV